jgi:outer membrane protein assembly factor BamE
MRYFLLLLFVLLVGCGSTIPTVKPFKMDIQQGNVVTSKMLLQLRPGMTKSQVKFIMGSPLLIDSFHTNRWDYFYQLRQAGKIVEQRRVILDFDKELLAKVRGDVVPEGTAGAATGAESSVAKTITVEPKPKQEEGMLDKLKFWKSDEKVATKPEAVKPAAEKSWTEKLKFWQSDEVAKDAVKPETIVREKNDAPEANIEAPSGDASTSNVEMPSVLAVPIGGVLTADAPAVEVPAVDAPTLNVPAVDASVIAAPAEMPVTPLESMAKTVEVPIAEAPTIEMTEPVSESKPVAMPEPKSGERLIFRLDRNLNLKNLEVPVQALPVIEVPKIDNKAAPTTAKPRKIEPPLPVEDAPGYFERMLEKIGF